MSFITGVAVMVVAVTLAITISLRPSPDDLSGDSAPAEIRFRTVETRDRGAADERRASDRRSERTTGEIEQTRFSVNVPPEHPERLLLAPKAAMVQTYAEGRLDELDRQLDLSATQRKKLFPILARVSESYDPAMVISGIAAGAPALTVATAEVAIQNELEPTQRDERIELSLNDMALWKEIIVGLERQLEEQSPKVSAGEADLQPGSEAAPSGGAPSSPARGNLFNGVEPNR